MKNKSNHHHTLARIIELSILIFLPLGFHWLLPISVIIRFPYTLIGILLIGVGIVLNFSAAAQFRKVNTGFELNRENQQIVTTGPFKITRNPMYLGMLLWLCGLAIFLGSLSPFIFPVILFVMANFYIIPFEENKLENEFGEKYNAYKKKVRRWI